jgi:hypothetical protein
MQLYVRDRHVVKKNNLFLKLQVALFGHAKLCEYERLEFYAFRCPVHGLATDYARGYDRHLECSYCRNG